MRKLKLYIAASIDGYIARPDGSVDWLDLESNSDYGYKEFNQSIDTVLMGYQTYKVSLSLSKDPFKGKKYYVFTKNHSEEVQENVSFVSGDIKAFVNRLKRENSGKDIWLMGGGHFIKSLIESSVIIDDWMIFIIPKILGEGISLFQDTGIEKHLNLVDFKSYDNGIVLSHYRPK